MNLRILLFVAILAVGLSAQVEDSHTVQSEKFADTLAQRLGDEPHPGFALAVFQRGKVLWFRGEGYAEIENRVPIDRKTNFRVGSMAKQFTGAAIAILDAEKKLSLDDPIRKYFPEFPAYLDVVTIRHLVHHTSGLRDYLELYRLEGFDEQKLVSPQESLRQIARQKHLEFKPQSQFEYSNTNYFLMAEIVARVTKGSFRDFIEERIFDKLGMTSSRVMDENRRIIPRRAAAYSRYSGAWRRDVTRLEHVGDGGIFTSIEELALWDANFFRDQLTSDGSLPKVLRRAGPFANYGFGLMSGDYQGLDIDHHSGGFAGFRAQLVRFPKLGFSFCVLANCGHFSVDEAVFSLAHIWLEKNFLTAPKKPSKNEEATEHKKPKADKETIVPLPKALAAQLSGEWASDEILAPWRFALRAPFLEIQVGENKISLSHISDTRFGAGPYLAHCVIEKDKLVRIELTTREGTPPRVFHRKVNR